MQAANEIKSATNNIRYYVDKVKKLISSQFDLDMEDYRLGEKMREDVLAESLRFNCSGEIAAACGKIELLCQDIERQVQIAEKQDKKG